MIHAAIVAVCGGGYWVRKGKAPYPRGPARARSRNTWAGRIRSDGWIRGQHLLGERPAICLYERQRCTSGFEVVGGGKPLKQLEPVVGKEKEGFVFLDWPAKGTAKLVLNIFRPLGKDGICGILLVSDDRSTVIAVIKEIVGVQRGIAVLLIRHAVKLICARLLIRADHSSHTAAVLGTHAVDDDGEVFNGLKRRINIQSTRTKVVVIFCAVEHVRGAGLSGPSGSWYHIQPHAHLRCHKGKHVENVAVHQGGVLNRRAIHLESEIRSGCLN